MSAGEVIVKTPDGNYAFPDQASADRYLQSTGVDLSSKGEDYARGAGRGAVRGMLSMADLGVAAAKDQVSENPTLSKFAFPILGPGALVMQGAAKVMPDKVQAIRDYMDRVKAPGQHLADTLVDKPAGQGAKYTEEGVAGATGALAMPGSVATNLVTGAAGGVGGELAAKTLGDSTLNRIVGAIVGSLMGYAGKSGAQLAYSALGGPSTKTPRMVADAVAGLSKEDLDKAAALQATAKGEGVKITPAQAVDKPTPLHQLQESTIASEQGGPKMREFLAKQNPDAAAAGKGMLGGVPAGEPAAVAREAQGTATSAIETARKMRTEAVKPNYETIKDPTVASVPALKANIGAQIEEIGPTTEAGRFLEREINSKIGDKWSVIDHGDQIKTLLNEAKSKLGNESFLSSLGIDRFTAQKIRQGMAPLEEFVTSQSVNRKQGDASFAEISKNLVNPLKSGPIGQMAGTKGLVEDVPTATARVLNTLDSPHIRSDSILNAQSWMSHEKAGSFSRLVATHVEQKLEKAFAGAKEGIPDPQSPSKFAAAIWGTPEQTAKRENFRAMMVGAARDAGLDEHQTLRGAENLMRVMEAAGRAKAGMGSAPPTVGAAEAAIARVGPGSSNSFQIRFLSNIDNMLNGKAYKEIADMLTSPDGMKQLREWAKYDISKIRWGAAASAGVAAGQQGTKEK